MNYLIVFSIIACFSISGFAAVIHVPVDQPSIQDGLSAAAAGDTVLVASGTYPEHIVWPGVAGIHLYSETGAQSCVVSGSDTFPVFTIRDVRGVDINGFTIRDGRASGGDGGGGIYASGSDLILEQCIIRNNSVVDAWGGAGVFIRDGAIEITHCHFIANNAENSALGCAVALISVQGKVLECTFSQNAGTVSYPSVLSLEYASITIEDNIFSNNDTAGIFLWDGGGIIAQNVFSHNTRGITSHENTAVVIDNNLVLDQEDDGMFITNYLQNSRIVGNTIAGCGVGITIMNIQGQMTVEENIVTGGRVGINEIDSAPPTEYFNNDVWNNSVNYQGIPDLTGTGGNISLDPLFCSDGFGDYFLSRTEAGQAADSPCADAGNEPAPEGDLTTRTDHIRDTGIRDIGYHYCADPQATPTPSATPTPVPTATATPTESPTPVPDTTGVEIIMPSHLYTAGDTCWCIARVCNAETDPLTGYPLFVILDVFGTLFFAPDFTETPDNYLDSYPQIPPGKFDVSVLRAFAWPPDAGSARGLVWYGALTNPEMTELFGEMGRFSFGYE